MAGAGVAAQGLALVAGLLEERGRQCEALGERGRTDEMAELGLEVRSEHLVVPVGAVVERHHELLELLELPQLGVAPVAGQELVGEGPVDDTEHGCVEEEAAQVVGECVEHVAGEVLACQRRTARCHADQPALLRRRLVAHREVEQLEARGPPLDALGEPGDVLRRQSEPAHLVQQPFGLPGAEAEIVRSDLEQLAGEPQPGDVERRHRARADRQPDVIGGVDDEPGDRRLGRAAANLVQVVDHDHDRAVVDRLEAMDRVVDRHPTGDLEIERASPTRGRDGRRTARRSRRADPCAARSSWHR